MKKLPKPFYGACGLLVKANYQPLSMAVHPISLFKTPDLLNNTPEQPKRGVPYSNMVRPQLSSC